MGGSISTPYSNGRDPCETILRRFLRHCSLPCRQPGFFSDYDFDFGDRVRFWPGMGQCLRAIRLAPERERGLFLGRLVGQEVLYALAGERLGRLIDRANHHGFLAVLALRVVPFAPFTLVNMLIGASGIRFRDFFGELSRPGSRYFDPRAVWRSLENALRKPGLASFALLVIILVAVPIIVSRMFRRFYERQAD